MAEQTTMSDEASRREMKEMLARYNCRVHQPDDPPLFSRMPVSATQTVHWRGKDLSILLDRLGQELSLDAGGQRRTLRLANPGLNSGTTHTFWASIQVILPGEIATAHRHTANAFRFIMKGNGATTNVNGECYEMNEGDLVLTPSMMWHDHEYHGNRPMIWLDILDISLMQSLHATFFENYSSPQQKVDAIADRSFRQYGSGLLGPVNSQTQPEINPLLAYPSSLTMQALEQAKGLTPDPFDDVILAYKNPATGGPVMRTLGMCMQILRPGMKGKARRHTGSKLYYIVKGKGITLINGQEYAWEAGDFLTIQPWAWYEHKNPFNQEALMFQVNDFPTMEATGYYFEEHHPQGYQSQQPQH